MIYTIPFTAVAVTAAQDLFELTADTSSRFEVCEIAISQYSDAGDAQAELASIQVIRGHATPGSGGNPVTPTKWDSKFRAAKTAAKVNNTTIASGGTAVTLISDSFNVQAGWYYRQDSNYIDSKNERMVVNPGEILVIRLPNSPADSITMNGTIKIKELGG